MNRFLPWLVPTFLASRLAFAHDAVAAKMLALFPRFDADHNGALSPEEQASAVESVGKTYGDPWGRQVRTMFDHAAAVDKSVTAERWRQQVAAYTPPPAIQPLPVQTV